MSELILRECPFCGSPAELHRGQQLYDGQATHYVLVRCTKCKASTRRADYRATEPCNELEEEKVAYLWNRRTHGRDNQFPA